MSVKIKILSENNLDDAVCAEKICFNDPWTKGIIYNEIKKQNAHCIIAEKDGETCGFAALEWVLDEGCINRICTLPKFRQQGIADVILSYLIDYARKIALAAITLEVRKSNVPAAALYEKHGFKSVGERKGYYQNGNENAVIFTKDLREGA